MTAAFAALGAIWDCKSVHAGDASPALRVDPTRLRSGDLVFRVGVGWRADAVRLLSRDSLSHVGIAVVEPDGVHVVHAEPPGDGDAGGVVDQTLDGFSSPAVASGVVAYRRRDIDAAAGGRVAAAAVMFAHRRIPFDDRFDLADARAFYCTELVLRASVLAGVPLTAPTTRITAGVLAGRYVFPRDLLADGLMEPVG